MWIPVHKHWRLNERHYGALQGLNKAETAAKHGEAQVKIWRRSYDIPPPPLTADDQRYPGARSALRGPEASELPLDRVAEGHGRALPAVLARDDRAGDSRRSARAHRRARQQPARAGEVPRRRQRAGDRRAEHPHRHAARLRARRGAQAACGTTTWATRRPRRRPRRGWREQAKQNVEPTRTCPNTPLRRRHRRRRSRRAHPRAAAAAWKRRSCACSSPRSRTHPVPEAAFKVGESSVEIGAHYFHTRLEPRRRICASSSSKSSASAISSRRRTTATSTSASSSVRRASRRCRRFSSIAAGWRTCCSRPNARAGVEGSTMPRASLASSSAQPHRIEVTRPARRARDHMRDGWSMPRAGTGCCAGSWTRPRGRPRRQRQLVARPRAREDRRLVASTGVARPGTAGQRWLSTNHLMGAGYWVWLIPLGSGSTSFGIVADERPPPLRADQSLRPRDGLAARVRAAVRGGRGGARRPARRLPGAAPLRPWLPSGATRPIAGR